MTQKTPLQGGMARVTIVESRSDDYVKVKLEYRSHSANGPGVPQFILQQMVSAAQRADLAILTQQRPDEVVEGETLTPDGKVVLLKWIPLNEDEVIGVEGRPATPEDLASLPMFGESPLDMPERVKKARAAISGIELATQIPPR